MTREHRSMYFEGDNEDVCSYILTRPCAELKLPQLSIFSYTICLGQGNACDCALGVFIKQLLPFFLWCWHGWWCLCLPRCKGSLFTYDLACSNWWNGDMRSFILLEWCAFSLDVTAEYEYENMKRAVESARVVIFMRIRHNVFTSLVPDYTVYYVNGSNCVCVGCQLFKCTRVSCILHMEEIQYCFLSTNDNLSQVTKMARSFPVNIWKIILEPHWGTIHDSVWFCVCTHRRDSKQWCDSVLKVCIWGIARIRSERPLRNTTLYEPWHNTPSASLIHKPFCIHSEGKERHTGIKDFIIVTYERECKAGLSRLLDAMKIWCGKYPVGAAFLIGTMQTQELSSGGCLWPSVARSANDFAPPSWTFLRLPQVFQSLIEKFCSSLKTPSLSIDSSWEASRNKQALHHRSDYWCLVLFSALSQEKGVWPFEASSPSSAVLPTPLPLVIDI